MIGTQEALTQAWNDLQAVPSYLETQAALFARSTTYEVYQMNGYCEKDWELLGKIQVTSYPDLEAQVRRNWPDIPDILAIDSRVGTITTLDTVRRSVARPVAS